MKVLFFLYFFILISSSFIAKGQDQVKIDSLKTALPAQSPSEQYETLIALAFQYIDKDNQSAIEFIEQAFSIANQQSDTIRIVRSGRIKGQLLRRQDRLDEAMEIFKKLIPVAKRNNLRTDYKVMLNSLAIAYLDRANYDKALEFHFQSLLIREAEGNLAEVSIALNNIGLVYFKLNDFNKAIDYYLRSLDLKRKSKDSYGIDNTMINIGLCYNSLHQFDKALEYITKGLEFCGNDCSDQTRIEGENGLGWAYFSLHELEKAKEHFTYSYDLSKKQDNKRFQVENLLMFAKISVLNGEYDKAISELISAEQLAQHPGYNRLLIDVYREFSSLYKERQNFEQASYYQDKYIHLKDSILSETLIKNLAAVQTKFEERENIKTIATRDEELSQQRQLIIAVVIIAVLAGLLVFMLFKSNAAKKKANDRLDREVQAATKELAVANTLLGEVNKELDHFIYKTSHDIRGPLASLKGLCNVALTDVKDPLAIDYFSKLEFTATHLDTLLRRLQKINQINHDELKIQPIDFKKLVDELEVLETKKGLPDRLVIKKDIQASMQFSSDKDLIYLILENLMDNAIKFHNSSDWVSPFVLVKIDANTENLVIRVIDNGVGIGQTNPEELFQLFVRATERSISGGIGLYMSRRAAERLGGEIHMRTTSEGYTEFYVTLPKVHSNQA